MAQWDPLALALGFDLPRRHSFLTRRQIETRRKRRPKFWDKRNDSNRKWWLNNHRCKKMKSPGVIYAPLWTSCPNSECRVHSRNWSETNLQIFCWFNLNLSQLHLQFWSTYPPPNAAISSEKASPSLSQVLGSQALSRFPKWGYPQQFQQLDHDLVLQKHGDDWSKCYESLL